MDRREFLKDAARTILVLPFGTFLIRCKKDEEEEAAPPQPDNGPPDAPPRLDGEAILYTSNKVTLHSHAFTVPVSALDAPPEEGVIGETTPTNGHHHALEITPDALLMAASGQPVKLITSSANGHAHTFTIVKV